MGPDLVEKGQDQPARESPAPVRFRDEDTVDLEPVRVAANPCRPDEVVSCERANDPIDGAVRLLAAVLLPEPVDERELLESQFADCYLHEGDRWWDGV